MQPLTGQLQHLALALSEFGELRSQIAVDLRMLDAARFSGQTLFDRRTQIRVVERLLEKIYRSQLKGTAR